MVLHYKLGGIRSLMKELIKIQWCLNICQILRFNFQQTIKRSILRFSYKLPEVTLLSRPLTTSIRNIIVIEEAKMSKHEDGVKDIITNKEKRLLATKDLK